MVAEVLHRNCKTPLVLDKGVFDGAAPPPGFSWTASLARMARLLHEALARKEPALLVGPTGTGKTTAAAVAAQAMGLPLVAVNLHQHTETADLLGGVRPVRDQGETRFAWQDGPLVQAMRRGEVLLLDEISLADDAVLERLNSVLEPERSLVLAEKGGTDDQVVVEAHANFHLVATMNPGGDFGKKELSAALRNRFTEIWVPSVVDAPSAEELLTIVQQMLTSTMQRFAQPLSTFARRFNQEVAVEERYRLSLRDVLSWVRFCNHQAQGRAVDEVSPAELEQIFWNGAELAVLDGVGIGGNAARSAAVKLQLKARSVLEECTGSQLNPPALQWSDDAEWFGVGEFRLAKGEEHVDPSVMMQFSFEAMTTKTNLFRVLRAMQSPDTRGVLLEGAPGVGKTSLITALAARARRRLVRINLSEQTDTLELLGTDLPVEGGRPGEFAWRDGLLLQALQQGDWVLLDELNLASQSVLEGLNAILDHRRRVYLPQLGREFVCADSFLLFACQNPVVMGGGRKSLPRSFLNRFVKVHLGALQQEDLQAALLRAAPHLSPAMAVSMTAFNRHVQQMAPAGFEFNLRDLLRWAALLKKDAGVSKDLSAKVLWPGAQLLYARLGDALLQQKVKRAFESHFGVIEADPSVVVLQGLHKLLEQMAMCVLQQWSVLLVGGPSSGKTSAAKALAQLRRVKLHQLTLTDQADASELVGSFEQADVWRHVRRRGSELMELITELESHRREAALQIWAALQNAIEERDQAKALTMLEALEGVLGVSSATIDPERLAAGTYEWVDGLLMEAMKRGEWVLLDGANRCHASVLDRLNPLLDGAGGLVVSERGGDQELVKAHPDFRLFLDADPSLGHVSQAMRNRCVEIHLSGSDSFVTDVDTGLLLAARGVAGRELREWVVNIQRPLRQKLRWGSLAVHLGLFHGWNDEQSIVEAFSQTSLDVQGEKLDNETHEALRQALRAFPEKCGERALKMWIDSMPSCDRGQSVVSVTTSHVCRALQVSWDQSLEHHLFATTELLQYFQDERLVMFAVSRLLPRLPVAGHWLRASLLVGDGQDLLSTSALTVRVVALHTLVVQKLVQEMSKGISRTVLERLLQVISTMDPQIMWEKRDETDPVAVEAASLTFLDWALRLVRESGARNECLDDAREEDVDARLVKMALSYRQVQQQLTHAFTGYQLPVMESTSALGRAVDELAQLSGLVDMKETMASWLWHHRPRLSLPCSHQALQLLQMLQQVSRGCRDTIHLVPGGVQLLAEADSTAAWCFADHHGEQQPWTTTLQATMNSLRDVELAAFRAMDTKVDAQQDEDEALQEALLRGNRAETEVLLLMASTAAQAGAAASLLATACQIPLPLAGLEPPAAAAMAGEVRQQPQPQQFAGTGSHPAAEDVAAHAAGSGGSAGGSIGAAAAAGAAAGHNGFIILVSGAGASARTSSRAAMGRSGGCRRGDGPDALREAADVAAAREFITPRCVPGAGYAGAPGRDLAARLRPFKSS